MEKGHPLALYPKKTQIVEIYFNKCNSLYDSDKERASLSTFLHKRFVTRPFFISNPSPPLPQQDIILILDPL